MVVVASLELPDGGVPGQHCIIQLQLGVPSWMAHVGRRLSPPASYQGSPPSFLSCFLLLRVSLRDQLRLLNRLFLLLFFFKFRLRSKPTGEGGGGRGGVRGSWDPETSLGPTPYPSRGRTILSSYCLAASRFPLWGRCHHAQRRADEIGQLSTCLTCPQKLGDGLQVLPVPPFPLWGRIGQSQLQGTSMRRLFPSLEQLHHEESVEEAVQLVGGLLELGNQAQKCRSMLVEDLLPLLLSLRLGIDLTRAWSWVLSGRITIAYLHSRIP